MGYAGPKSSVIDIKKHLAEQARELYGKSTGCKWDYERHHNYYAAMTNEFCLLVVERHERNGLMILPAVPKSIWEMEKAKQKLEGLKDR
jgi:hypothetical protein